MHHPFVAVVLAVLAGILALLVVDPVAPGIGPVVALVVMGGALRGAAVLMKKGVRAGADASSAVV